MGSSPEDSGAEDGGADTGAKDERGFKNVVEGTSRVGASIGFLVSGFGGFGRGGVGG